MKEAVSYKFICEDCGAAHAFTQKIDALLYICWKCNNPLTIKLKRQKPKETEDQRRKRLMKNYRK